MEALVRVDPIILVLAVLAITIGAYAFGEWVGAERERMRWERRHLRRRGNVIDFTRRDQ
jgi:hypothetical protein